MSEFDTEPVPGLPALPPKGEHVLWRGAPDWRVLALRAFRIRGLAFYFGVIAVWKLIGLYEGGGSWGDAGAAVATLAAMAAVAVAFFAVLSWLVARSTVYTITNKRVVMRIGVALPVTFNLPFTMIDGAALRPYEGEAGDITLQLRAGERVAYAVLWPHVRPWRFSQPEPMLRCVPQAAAVARLLGEALAAASNQDAPVPVSAQTAERPRRPQTVATASAGALRAAG